MSCERVERDLDAYLDRELDAEASAAVRQHVSACAACRRQLAQRETLSRLVRGAPYYSAPDGLRARVLAQSTRSTSVRRVRTWAAAAMLVLSVGAVITLWRPSSRRGDAIADELVNSHVRSLMANHLVDVQSEDVHTVKPWFLGKLDFSPPTVDLASNGFPLVGGRLDYVGGRAVAALVYRRQRHVINVFVAPGADPTTRDVVLSLRGFNLRHWIHSGMSFWAVSDLTGAELGEFSSALQAP